MTPCSQNNEKIHLTLGRRIRDRRKVLGLTQSQLAGLLGLASYQQVQHYEAGTRRLLVSDLLQFARILNVPPSYFYEGIKLDSLLGTEIESDVIPTIRTKPLRLLLVEGNHSDAFMFKTALNDSGLKTELDIVHNSEEAISLIRACEVRFSQHLPDILVIALLLEKTSGFEVLQFVKTNPKTRALPVIILTNSISMKDMTDSYKRGASGFIQKSSVMEEYREHITSLVKYWSETVVLPSCA